MSAGPVRPQTFAGSCKLAEARSMRLDFAPIVQPLPDAWGSQFPC